MSINTEVREILLNTGYNVVFQYPKGFRALPVISFYTIKEYGAESYDNEEAFRNAEVVVDIWANAPTECEEIAQYAAQAMANDGWSELFRMDVPRGSNDIYHRNMRFIKSFYTDN